MEEEEEEEEGVGSAAAAAAQEEEVSSPLYRPSEVSEGDPRLVRSTPGEETRERLSRTCRLRPRGMTAKEEQEEQEQEQEEEEEERGRRRR